MGRRGSFRPARARRTALAMLRIASSCPTTFWCSASSMWSSRSDSSDAIRETGIPVHIETTSQISSWPTTAFSSSFSLCHPALKAFYFLLELCLAIPKLSRELVLL